MPLRTNVIFAILLVSFSPAAVVAQQAIETCPAVPIIPQPPTDMTKRLNDDLDCLWRKVQDLVREVDRLKQGQSTKGQTSLSPPSDTPVVEDGVEITPDAIFLSDDKKTISASIKIKNTNSDDVLIMLVGTESVFIIPNMINRAPIIADGINNCTPHAGNSASTWLCLGDNDIRWSSLDRDRVYPTRLTSMLDRPVTATIADIRLHFLIKKEGKAKPHDVSLNGIGIK